MCDLQGTRQGEGTEMRTVYFNGQFIPESEAKLSIYDLSVMQSAAAFEMTRSFNGKHFKLREHLERLYQSCRLLSIPIPQYHMDERVGEIPIDVLLHLCHQVAERNDHGPGEEHRLLIVVSPGCAPMYRELDGLIPHPFLYIADFPLRYTVKGFSKYFTEGVHCVTSKVQQVPDACVPSAAKHRSRLHFHLAQMQAPAGTWPLMTCQRDHGDEGTDYEYAEAPGANIVWVDKKSVYCLEKNALPGISLQTVQQLIPTEKLDDWMQPHESYFHPRELWLTGTPFCMLPVVSLDGKPIGNGTPGPVFKQTLQKWNELVGVDIQRQIEEWDAVRPESNQH